MKRFFLLLLVSILGQTAICQTDFIVDGAKWVYYTPGSSAWSTTETLVTYVGDTTIGGFQGTKKLTTKIRYQFLGGPINYSSWNNFVRQTNDSVFHWVDGSWELIFDYGAQVGDTRVVYIEGGVCTAHDTMLIESIDTVYSQGLSLRRTYYRILLEDQLNALETYNWGTLQHSYLERVGFRFDSPIGSPIYCSGAVPEYMAQNLTCYTDTEILNNGGASCSLVLSTKKTREPENEKLIFSLETLQILNASNATIHVYDILGKELFQTTISSDNQSINIEHLPNGVLVIVLETTESRIVKKVVKTRN